MTTLTSGSMQNWLGLSDSHIQWLDKKHGLCKPVLDALLAMQKHAHLDGVDLQIASSFRSFSKQLSIWNRKWSGELSILSKDNQEIDAMSLADEDKMHAILLWSALPGASRHHWGTDLDVFDKRSVEASGHKYEMIADEYEGQGPCARLSEWLQHNSEAYGFYRPYHSYVGGIGAEPWHISHKQEANRIATNYQKQLLFDLLSKSNIKGKHVILAHFDNIYHRYVLNKGA